MPAAGLLAHTLVSRFVDHLPYYRQEQINARSGVHTPRSTLAPGRAVPARRWMPLYDVHKRFVLASAVLHADETPVAMLDPGAGKTKKAYVWAYARGAFDRDAGRGLRLLPRARREVPGQSSWAPREGEPAGAARSCATNTAAYESVVDANKHPGASPQAAWPTRGGSSTS